MQVSEDIMKNMGFQRLPDGETIEAVFYSAHIYSVRGFTTDAGALNPLEGKIDDVTYRLAVGASIYPGHARTRKLSGDMIRKLSVTSSQ